MAPRSWATNEQTAFLEARLDAFIKSQLEKTTKTFWRDLEAAWLQQFPDGPIAFQSDPLSEHDMTEEQKNMVKDAQKARMAVSLSCR